jgi:putative acetyltransferase
MQLEIREDDLNGPEIAELLAKHLDFARSTSPPGSVHALDLDSLRVPEITFWSAWSDGKLLGSVALKEIEPSHAEIKSMHTSVEARGQGIGEKLVEHLILVATQRGYKRLSLETGRVEAFAAARRLYQRFGFQECPPFADYFEDPFSVCMNRIL